MKNDQKPKGLPLHLRVAHHLRCASEDLKRLRESQKAVEFGANGRSLAVSNTMLEQVIAYYDYFVCRGDEDEDEHG